MKNLGLWRWVILVAGWVVATAGYSSDWTKELKAASDLQLKSDWPKWQQRLTESAQLTSERWELMNRLRVADAQRFQPLVEELFVRALGNPICATPEHHQEVYNWSLQLRLAGSLHQVRGYRWLLRHGDERQAHWALDGLADPRLPLGSPGEITDLMRNAFARSDLRSYDVGRFLKRWHRGDQALSAELCQVWFDATKKFEAAFAEQFDSARAYLMVDLLQIREGCPKIANIPGEELALEASIRRVLRDGRFSDGQRLVLLQTFVGPFDDKGQWSRWRRLDPVTIETILSEGPKRAGPKEERPRYELRAFLAKEFARSGQTAPLGALKRATQVTQGSPEAYAATVQELARALGALPKPQNASVEQREVGRKIGRELAAGLINYIERQAETFANPIERYLVRSRLDGFGKGLEAMGSALAKAEVEYLPADFILQLQKLFFRFEPRREIAARVTEWVSQYLVSSKGMAESELTPGVLPAAVVNFLKPENDPGNVKQSPLTLIQGSAAEDMAFAGIVEISHPLICDFFTLDAPAFYEPRAASGQISAFLGKMRARGMDEAALAKLKPAVLKAYERSCVGSAVQEMVQQLLLGLGVVPHSGRPVYRGATRREAEDFLRQTVWTGPQQTEIAPRPLGFFPILDAGNKDLLPLSRIRRAVAQSYGDRAPLRALLALGQARAHLLAENAAALFETGLLPYLAADTQAELSLPADLLGVPTQDPEPYNASLLYNRDRLDPRYLAREMDVYQRAYNSGLDRSPQARQKGYVQWRQTLAQVLLEYHEALKLLTPGLPAETILAELQNSDRGALHLGGLNLWEHLQSIDGFGGGATLETAQVIAKHYRPESWKGAEAQAMVALKALLPGDQLLPEGHCGERLLAALNLSRASTAHLKSQPSDLWRAFEMSPTLGASCKAYLAPVTERWLLSLAQAGGDLEKSLWQIFHQRFVDTLQVIRQGLIDLAAVDSVDELLRLVGGDSTLFTHQFYHRVEWQALAGQYRAILEAYQKQLVIDDQNSNAQRIAGCFGSICLGTGIALVGILGGPAGLFIIGSMIAAGGYALSTELNVMTQTSRANYELQLRRRLTLDGSRPWRQQRTGTADKPVFLLPDLAAQRLTDWNNSIWWGSFHHVSFAVMVAQFGGSAVVWGGRAVLAGAAAVEGSGLVGASGVALRSAASSVWANSPWVLLGAASYGAGAYTESENRPAAEAYQKEQQIDREHADDLGWRSQRQTICEIYERAQQWGVTLKDQARLDFEMKRLDQTQQLLADPLLFESWEKLETWLNQNSAK